MVTVSNFITNPTDRPAQKGNLVSTINKNHSMEKSFSAKPQKHEPIDSRKYKQDTVLKNSLPNRMWVNFIKTMDIPMIHFPRGFMGTPDYTFYEFLQTAKFPYYIGGPILAALFYAGVKKDNFKSAKAANKVAKHMALGVGFYYVGAALAKSIVNNTLKITRGIDLKHPYAKAISTSTSQTGDFKKEVEFRTLYESCEFTRTDLIFDHKGTEKNIDPEKIIKKYGVKGDVNDADQTVKPLIKKSIIMARAWQYALTAFFVTLGIGIANQQAWDVDSRIGFKTLWEQKVKNKSLPKKVRLQNLKSIANEYALQPFVKSCKQFWQGHSKASSIIGKSVILSTAAATLLAISLISTKTSARGHKLESSGTNIKQNEEVK